MVKGMQFLIDDSYTMDDDDDNPSPSSSPPPPQSNENGNVNVKLPPPENPSPQLAYAEEKKSDTPNNSVGSSNILGDAVMLMSDEHDNNIGSDEQQELIDAETTNSTASMITPQSSNLHEPQTIKEESSTAVTINDDSNANEQQQPTKSTMAMVKLRVWDPAAPSKQFKFITATTVLLLPQDDNLNDDSSNAIDTTDHSNDGNIILAPKKYQDSRNQKRLSVVKEERRTERRTSSGTIFEDGDYEGAKRRPSSNGSFYEDETEGTDAASSNDWHADLDNYHHAILSGGESSDHNHQQGRREMLERQKTVKIDNISIKNDLSQLSQLVEEGESDDDDDVEQLQVGNLIGIHLIKKTPSTTAASLSTNSSAHHNKNEWKVGNSIRVLHNLNLIPLHTTGLEQLLYQIEQNDPSLRELILDGITTPPLSSSPQQQQPPPLSFKHLEVLIEAIGPNTSIKKCSLQHSQITNEIASMLALALVDNTTMTSLSLRGNDLTSVAVQNFYSVLNSGENRTLRVLDISNNVGIDEDVSEAFETFMEQRAVKRMLTLKAEKAKRIAKGLPLLNEMLEEESEDDWRIGSGGGGGRRRSSIGIGGGGDGGCGVTVVCHPDIIDGTFHNNGPNNDSSSAGNNSSGSTLSGSGSRPEDDRRYYDSVSSELTGLTGLGLGNEPHAAFGGSGLGGFEGSSPPQQQQQPQIVSELYSQSQQYQQQQEPMPSPQRSSRHFDPNYSMESSQLSQRQLEPMPSPQRSNRHFDPDYSMNSSQLSQQQQPPMPSVSPQRSNRQFDPNYSMASSQVSSNDSSTSNTGNENLDQRQRQQLATVNSNNNNNSVRFSNDSSSRSSNRNNLRPSTLTNSSSQYSRASSRNSLNPSTEDYFDDKATERELRRQLATQGQAVGAYAIDDEAPHRQEVRGRRTRVSRTESQRRARLSELSGVAPTAAAAATTMNSITEGGDIVEADIERMEEYEYRNLSMYDKFFYRIGLDGEDNKTERVICLTFGVCILVLLVAIILYAARD
eukprot:scaffold10716_cov91-Skeletonema_marinoi.AAC.5